MCVCVLLLPFLCVCALFALNIPEFMGRPEDDALAKAVEYYPPLVKYFEGYTLKDIRNLTRDDFMQIADPRERILMNIFYQKTLRHLLSSYNAFQLSSYPEKRGEFSAYFRDNAVLMLSALVQNEHQSFDCSKWTPKEVLQECSDLDDSILEGIHTINLSSNYLADDDVDFIIELVQIFSKCATNISVDLTDNDFILFDSKLLYLLDIEQVQWVNVCSTRFASAIRTDFYERLSIEYFKKLIWIPEHFVQGKEWTNLIKGHKHYEQVRDIVRQAHLKYYKKSE
jgi:hypothetical protein